MKKNLSIISVLIFVSFSYSQTLFLEENFNFTGNLTSNGWTAHSGAGTNPINTTTGLSYSGYPSSGIGNAALVDDNGEDVNIPLSSTQTAGTIYFSFLINVISTSLTSTYEIHLQSGAGSSSGTFAGRVWIQKESTSNNFRFGISKLSTSSISYTPYSYFNNNTYLVVLKYSIISGTANDDVALFIFSSGVPASEPIPTLSHLTESTADPANIGSVCLRQANPALDFVIDGIRVADSWSQAPLPVELSSFSASIINNGVKLNWRTETEVNNYGFEIEKSQMSNVKSQTEWTNIGFVEGSGNSNSPKEYSFIDENVTSGKYAYKLKQIDNDGTFEYSKIIEVDVGIPLEFELSQNYPNPFNPTTTIKFSLPVTSKVKLSVYNILGEEVQILMNETKEAGSYTINFNALQLNSGMYFYKLETGNILKVKKMSLIR